jgi:hypothetical protein
MTSTIKKKIVSIENYESNVFNESNEEVRFSGTSESIQSDINNLSSNRRILLRYRILPEIEEEKTTVSLNSISNKTTFSDQNTKTVNVRKKTSPKVSFGIKNHDYNIDVYEDKTSNINTSSLELSKDLIKSDVDIINLYPLITDINANSIIEKGSCLDPLEIYKEITRDIITEYSTKGIKVYASKSGSIDTRKRSIEVTDLIAKNNNAIEPYDDQGEDDDLGKYFKQSKYYSGNIIKISLVNNQYTLQVDETKSRFKSISSKESRYLSEENNIIEPFFDSDLSLINNENNNIDIRENRFYIKSDILNSFFKNKDINIQKKIYNKKSDERYSSRGFLNNYSFNSGIESVSFRGRVK